MTQTTSLLLPPLESFADTFLVPAISPPEQVHRRITAEIREEPTSSSRGRTEPRARKRSLPGKYVIYSHKGKVKYYCTEIKIVPVEIPRPPEPATQLDLHLKKKRHSESNQTRQCHWDKNNQKPRQKRKIHEIAKPIASAAKQKKKSA